jgi:nicotinate-nucleotide--dimethylbenzimidazole phosphoribosyltransferase
MLESVGWARRAALDSLVFVDRWGEAPSAPLSSLAARTEAPRAPSQPPSDAPRDATRSIRDEAAARMLELTKPVGSLGRLEALALRLAGLQQRVHPSCERPHLLLFAGDHGVTVEGVSAYRREVTREMVYQYLAGGGAVSALARQHGVGLTVVDVGVDHDFGDAAGLVHQKVGRGTRNLAHEPAMTEAECEAARLAGRASVAALSGVEALGLGEMGIGNTTAASAIVAALLGKSAEQVVGRGTGIGENALARKRAVVERALALHPERDPDAVLRCLGGFEIAALVGAIEAAAERRMLVVLDGFITGAAALVAVRRRPELAAYLVAGHRSAEGMHGALLEALGLHPLLDLDMRLGEGSGAVLALGLVKSAAAIMREMRTFEEANMPRPEDPRGLE